MLPYPQQYDVGRVGMVFRFLFPYPHFLLVESWASWFRPGMSLLLKILGSLLGTLDTATYGK